MFATEYMESSILTRKQFALACGMPTNQLAVYAGDKHKKIRPLPDGNYDMNNDLNRAFYAMRRGKGYGMTLEEALTGATPKVAPRSPIRTRPKNSEYDKSAKPAHKTDSTAGSTGLPRRGDTPRAAVPAQPVPKVSLPPDDTGDEDDELDAEGIPGLDKSERRLKYFKALKEEHLAEKERLDLAKKRGDLLPSETVEPMVFQYKQHILTQMKVAHDKLLRKIAHAYSLKAEDLAEYRALSVKSLNDAVADADETFLGELDDKLTEFTNNRRRGER